MIYILITLLPMTVCLFWTLIICIDWHLQRSTAKLRLAVFSSAATLLYACHFIYFNHKYDALPVSDTLYCTANLSVYPLFYLYIKQVTESQWRLWRCVATLLPAIICGTTIAALYLMMIPEETDFFTHKQLYDAHYIGNSTLLRAQFIMHKIVKGIFAIQVPMVLILGYRKLKYFDEMVENRYADTEERNTRTLRATMMVMLVVAVASFVVNIIGRSYFCYSTLTLGIVSVIFSSLLFMLLYAGHKQDFTMKQLMEDDLITAAKDEGKNVGQNKTIEQLKEDIARIMTEEKLYLKRDLLISDLLQRLGTNRDYVYKAINLGMGMSFTEYVNRLRVEYAKELMRTNPSAPTIDIYTHAGFTSQASFFRNFKLYAGVTPKQYIQKNL